MRLTKRALDGWDSAAFSGYFLHPNRILLPSRIHTRPPASNANRWVAVFWDRSFHGFLDVLKRNGGWYEDKV